MSFIAYDGEALRSGEMDIRDLAPALIGLGDLVRDANRVLNGTRADATVKVRSDFRTGSFGIVIQIYQTLVQHAANLFEPASLVDAVALAKMLGLVAVAEKPKEIIESVFALAKFLGGEKATKASSVTDGKLEIVNQHGDTSIVNYGTLILLEDKSVRTDMRRIVAPLAADGIDVFETRDTPEGPPIEKISKSEARFLAAAVQKRSWLPRSPMSHSQK